MVVLELWLVVKGDGVGSWKNIGLGVGNTV